MVDAQELGNGPCALASLKSLARFPLLIIGQLVLAAELGSPGSGSFPAVVGTLDDSLALVFGHGADEGNEAADAPLRAPPYTRGRHAPMGRALRYTPLRREAGEGWFGVADRAARRLTRAGIFATVAGRRHMRGTAHVVIAARAI